MDGILPALTDPKVVRPLIALALVIGMVLLVRLATRTVAGRIDDVETRYRLQRLIRLAAYVVAIVGLLVIFSGNLRSFTVAFGVIGAGIAFALREVIVSVAGWLANSIGSYYKVGDRIQLAGIRGDVIDIGVLRTTLMEIGQWVEADQYSGRIVRISNSNILKEPVFNYSGMFPYLWDEIRLPITYGSDIADVDRILRRAAEAVVGSDVAGARAQWRNLSRRYLVEDTPIQPAIYLSATDNWLTFTLRYAVRYCNRRAAKDRLFRQLMTDIRQSEGRITLAAATYEIVGLPDLQVRLPGEQRTEPHAA